MENVFLYFAENESADAEADALMVPASSLLGIHPTAATTCNVYFKMTRKVEGTDADSTYNYVQLTYTSGKFKEVCESIIGKINNPRAASSSVVGMAVIADQDNAEYCNDNITNVEISYGDADVNPTN